MWFRIGLGWRFVCWMGVRRLVTVVGLLRLGVTVERALVMMLVIW